VKNKDKVGTMNVDYRMQSRIMTSSRIQDGGWPLIWKALTRQRNFLWWHRIAENSPARPLQGGHVRPPVVVRHFAIVPGRLVADRRLRSTASRTCFVTRTYSTFGDRAFSAAGPGLWNCLPSHLKDADLSYNEFRRSRSLKTFSVWTVGLLRRQ